MVNWVLVAFIFLSSLNVLAQEIAFPGAQGGGMYASGGRDGKVLFVTSLEDSTAPGTFRNAVSMPGKRTIIFKVSGTIFLSAPINITEGNLTIAGQSALGDGICIANYPVTIAGDNIIIRYLRFRMGYHGGVGSDGADAFGGRKTKNVIIDHCSINWSTDECSSFYDNENFTMQWCIISESLRLSGHSKGPHGYGAIWGGVNASFHHNLLANHDSRTPRFGPGVKFAGKDRTDARNNVFYNWNGNGCYGGEAMGINLVNNYYKPGPATEAKIAARVISISAKQGSESFKMINGIWGRYYINGNYFANNASLSANNWIGVNIEGNSRSAIEAMEPIDTTPIQTFDAQKAYLQVLAYSGCSKFRDEVDQRIIKEASSGTNIYIGLSPYNGEGKSTGYPKKGIIDHQLDLKPVDAVNGWSPWPVLRSQPAPVDTDEDGMPDSWEKENKLNPSKSNPNGREINSAYNNLEVYLNDLVKTITEKQYR